MFRALALHQSKVWGGELYVCLYSGVGSYAIGGSMITENAHSNELVNTTHRTPLRLEKGFFGERCSEAKGGCA